MPYRTNPIPLNVKFGMLTTLEHSQRRGPYATVKCRCDCGTEKVLYAHNVKNGTTRSCGCLSKTNPAVRVHGLRFHPVYGSWKMAVDRCYNTKNNAYADYGGRGIRVCEFIRSSPANLLMLLGEKPEDYSIERVGNSGNYSCGQCAECLRCGWKMNVKWASREEQGRNKRNNRWITHNGETKIIAEWCREYGIHRMTFEARLKAGLDPFTRYRRSKKTVEPVK